MAVQRRRTASSRGPQPAGDPSEERSSHLQRRLESEGRHYKWAALTHFAALSGFLGLPLGFVLGPLVIWLWKREQHPFIDRAGLEALNFQLTVVIALGLLALIARTYLLMAWPFFFYVAASIIDPVSVFLGAVWWLVVLGAFVITCKAGVDTLRGEEFRSPLAIRFFEPDRGRRPPRARDSDSSSR